RKHASRARNFWALGLVYWLFGRDRELTAGLLERKFANDDEVRNANLLALKAGHAYGETAELPEHEEMARVSEAAGTGKGRIISGTQAMALGIAAIPVLSQREVIYCSYPITPASALLHTLARYGNGVSTFQAEDEIAAASAAIGASYGGALGVTASSGPGLALKTEALGLAVMAELPLVVIDVQRAGPSTGMPTKPEQSDLTMAIHGRHGESPLPVFAPATPEDCFWVMIEAARTAIEAMTPVIVLSDAYLANAASDWTPPDVDSIPDIAVPEFEPGADGFKPYARDETTLARAWVAPGTKGLAHRIGGIEKQAGSGHISYDPANHAEMVRLRAEKIARISGRRPAIELENGPDDADILVIGWGSTHGGIGQAVRELNAEGKRAAHVHLRQLWPLPEGLGELLDRFPRAVTAEMNAGQLACVLRSEYLKPVGHIGNVTGQPFRVRDLKSAIAAQSNPLPSTDPRP
ncbi:MAG: 2-oxoacid:acceptor oxidoreductase subunit alpha, partial [Hyphomicrobiales bacterium]